MLASLSAWCVAILSLLLVYFLYFFILKPLISMKFYTDQGIKMPFFPLFGNVKGCLDAQATMDDFYGHWIKQIKNNPKTKIIGGNFLERPHLILVDPKLIKEFYKKQDNYIKLPKMADLLKVTMREGLVTTENEEWKRHRKLISSAFQYDLLRDMVPDVVKIANQSLDDLQKGDLNRVNLTLKAETIAGEVIGRLFFGEDFSDHRIKGEPVIAFLSDLVIRVGSQGSTLPYLIFGMKLVEWGVLPKYRQILKDVREFQSFSAAIIEKRKKEAQTNGAFAKSGSRSLIDIFLSQHDNSSEPFTTQEIINEFITFVGAGFDTTGGTVGRVLYYLSQNPQYKEKLMQEVNKYFADPSNVTLDSLNQMDFMTAFIKETLRFSPPLLGFFDREAIRDHTLGDIKISKGTVVNFGALLNNFNPTYHDDVDVFYPERWLTNSKTKESISQDTFVYLPFSSGARNCIGQHLAMNELRVMLSLFLKKYDFELDPDYKHQMTLRITYRPLNVMNFKLIPK